jgi:hypothetical protein
MPVLSIRLDGPEDLTPIPAGAKVHHVTEAFEVALVLGGMQSGAPSVMFRIPLPDGSFAIVETSLNLFDMAATAMRSRVEYLASSGGVRS